MRKSLIRNQSRGEEKVRINLNLPPSLVLRLRVAAIKRGESTSLFVRRLLERELRQEEV